MESEFGISTNGWAGLTTMCYSTQGYTNLNGGNILKHVNIMSNTGQICYIKEETTQNKVYKTITHELGHALGYFGHAPNSTDVMYYATNTSYTLVNSEKNHLKCCYTLAN